MTTLLSVLLACACGAAAKQPAKRSAELPDAPSAVRQKAADAAEDEKVRQALRNAVFLPKPVLPLLSYSDAQRADTFDLSQAVGHRDVTAESESQALPQGRSLDAFQQGGMGPYNRSKTESVELTFAQPAPGMTFGVGYSERKEWLGNMRAPKQSGAFAVLRITLGPSEDKPALFMPEARVSKRNDFQGEKVERYTIDDLPPGLRP